MTRALALLLAAVALVAAACGGDDSGSAQDARKLLEKGFAGDVDSGRVSVKAELQLEGVQGANGPMRLELSGPFRSRGPTKMPDVDLDLTASSQGLSFDGRVVLLPRNAWVEYGGETYEVGEGLWRRATDSLHDESARRTFGDVGVDPLDWVEDAKTEGSEAVAGAETTKITGELDVTALLRDFNRLSTRSGSIPRGAIDEIDKAIDAVDFEAWIGDDDIWRRIRSDTRFTVPEEQRQSAGGLSGGRLSFDMTLEDPNESVSIESPGQARPISELLQALGIPPEALLGPGFQAPEPG